MGPRAGENVLEKKVFVSVGNRTLDLAAHSLITTSTVLHQLVFIQANKCI
jgi:hypothetical protein